MLRHLSPTLPGRTRRTLVYVDRVPITLTFVERLWLALHVYPNDGPLHWSEDGVTFILDDDDFNRRALSMYPHLMTSGNVQSLIRNLYRYGFHISKVATRSNPKGEHTGVSRICFHPQFNKTKPTLLETSSPKTYSYMVDMACVLTAKVAAGVDPRVALTECLVGDDDYHQPDQSGAGEECLGGKPKLAISESQMSYHVPLDTSGSCPVKKRRIGSPRSGPEVTFPSPTAHHPGKKEVENDESPKKAKMGQNTLQFLQGLSIGNRWRATTQISPFHTGSESKGGYFTGCSFGNAQKKNLVARDSIERAQDETSSSSLPSLEPPNNPFTENNELLKALQKEGSLRMDENDVHIQSLSMQTNGLQSRPDLTCNPVSSTHAQLSGSVKKSPNKSSELPVSKHGGHSNPSTTLTHFPRIVMIPHVLTPGGYVPLIRPGGASSPLAKGTIATAAPSAPGPNTCHGNSEVGYQKGHAKTANLGSLAAPIVIEPREETLTDPAESQDDNEDWKSLTDESDSPRLHGDDQASSSPGPHPDEPIAGKHDKKKWTLRCQLVSKEQDGSDGSDRDDAMSERVSSNISDSTSAYYPSDSSCCSSD